MTDLDDQLRAYGAALRASQLPVELHEVIGRRRRRRGPKVAAVAIGVVVVLVAGVAGAVLRVESGSGRARTGPSQPSGHQQPVACPAASLNVTSASGERLHPRWLPDGYTLSNGDERALGANYMLEYLGPRASDRPYVEISRRHTALPPDRLVSGTNRPVRVNGHAGIASVGVPIPGWESVAWTETPGTVLIVTGHLVPEADLVRVADGVEYDPGTPFAYPIRPEVDITRSQALVTLGHGPVTDARAALTSFGEIDAVASGPGEVNRVPTFATDLAVIRPVWVVWSSDVERALVVDAQSGATIITIPHVHPRALDSLTDRSQPLCAPPFGVLTRSEVNYLRPTEAGATRVLKLSSLGVLDVTPPFADLAQCELSTCDPSVPVWLVVDSAPDHRYFDRMSRPCCGPPPSSPPGSFSLTALDARTGPQTTNFGSELGAGPAPRSILAVPDLAPSGLASSNAAHTTGSGPLPSDIASLICSNFASAKPSSIEYVATTERRETQVLDTEDGNRNSPVWVIEMRGSFTARGTRFHGTVATVTYDGATHASIGSGIVNQYRDLHVLGPVGTLTC